MRKGNGVHNLVGEWSDVRACEITEPEQRLAIAVVTRAIFDACTTSRRSQDIRTLRRNAFAFMCGNRSDKVARSFRWWLSFFVADVEDARKKIISFCRSQAVDRCDMQRKGSWYVHRLLTEVALKEKDLTEKDLR